MSDKNNELINKTINKITDEFPIEYNGKTYILINDVYSIPDDRYNCNIYIVDFIDDDGYKYSLNYNQVKRRMKKGGNFAKFFYYNKYTEDNMRIYLQNNNLCLTLEDHIDTYTKNNTKLKFFNHRKNKYEYITWAQVYGKSYLYDNNKNTIPYWKTKEGVIKNIYKIQEKLNRPLLQSDFEKMKTSEDTVGVRMIYKYFGNFSSMIKELGLPSHNTFFKPNSKNYKSHDYYLKLIEDVCEHIKTNEHRNIIMYNDFLSFDKTCEYHKLNNHTLAEGYSLNEYVKKYDCKIQSPGVGMHYQFDDGEITTSSHEYLFSNILRNHNLIYGKDYFRNVKYNTFIPYYKGNMDCDYKIIINDVVYYIELAGMLNDNKYINAYKNENPITNSNSKELYRKKLLQKEYMLLANDLNYSILFKPQMTADEFNNMINYIINYNQDHSEDTINEMFGIS